MSEDGEHLAADSTPEDGPVAFIERAGRLLSCALDRVAAGVRPGETTASVALRVRASLEACGLVCSLDAQVGAASRRFGHAAAISVNEHLAHGLPGDRVIGAGDLVTIDAAAGVRDAAGRLWHADAARSLVAGGAGCEEGARGRRLLEASEAVHEACLRAVGPGVRWGECVTAARRAAAGAGASIATDYCGHGVGQTLHASPRFSFRALDASADLLLRPGMIFTIEPVVVEGTTRPVCVTHVDGWTEVESSGRWGAYREETVLVTPEGVRVLTGREA